MICPELFAFLPGTQGVAVRKKINSDGLFGFLFLEVDFFFLRNMLKNHCGQVSLINYSVMLKGC